VEILVRADVLTAQLFVRLGRIVVDDRDPFLAGREPFVRSSRMAACPAFIAPVLRCAVLAAAFGISPSRAKP